MEMLLTLHHVTQSPFPDLLIIYSWLVQVLENINVRSKVDHVLLPTALRQLHQRVQVMEGQGQEITCGKGGRKQLTVAQQRVDLQVSGDNSSMLVDGTWTKLEAQSYNLNLFDKFGFSYYLML